MMNLQSSINLYGYGTSEGVTRAWDTRGRGRKEISTDVHNYVQSFQPIFDKAKTQFKVAVGQLGVVEGRLKTEASLQEKTEEDNKIENPSGPYRAYHLEAEVDGRPVELQVRTQNQSRLAIWMHDTLYKGAAGKSPVVQSYAKNLSDAIYKIDSGMRNVPIPDCPAPIRDNCFSFALPFTQGAI